MSKALVVLSGGQDSTTCLYWAKARYREVSAITFDYGQKHAIEIESAHRVARLVDVVNHEVLKLGDDVLAGTSPLTNRSETLEQYQDFNSLPGGLEKTFVPGRNMLFATLAANRAYVLGASSIVMGICQEDFGGYPDCREEFRALMQQTIQAGMGRFIKLDAPLMFKSKADTVRMARTFPGCWTALAFSHTAYDGAYPPTGKDHATLLREKGFAEAGLPDPLVLRAVYEGKMELPRSNNYTNIYHCKTFSIVPPQNEFLHSALDEDELQLAYQKLGLGM